MIANTKKTERGRWASRYRIALNRFLRQAPPARPTAAPRLGREAVALGLETLDAARIHERALAGLAPALETDGAGPDTRERARLFFAEATVPIEHSHRAAQKADAQLTVLTQTLRTRTREGSAASRSLQRGVVRRRTAEAALKKGTARRTGLLAEAKRQRDHLRNRTRNILTAQENERERNGRRLQDEIAQILLAIHVRLMTLKRASRASNINLKNEIAKTQQMVKQSVQTIKRLQHEGECDHEA